MLGANGVLLWASVLYLEGARAFRGLPPRRWSVSVGALATLGIVALLMEAQEQERDSIARELHDDLAQRATAIAVQLHT